MEGLPRIAFAGGWTVKVTRSRDGRLLMELTAEEQVFLEALRTWATEGGDPPEDVIRGAVDFVREYEAATNQPAD